MVHRGRRVRRVCRVRTVRMFRRAPSVLSPTICVGAPYVPLPRWALGHVPGFPGVPRVPSVLRVPGVPGVHWVFTAHMAPRVPMVPRVSMVPRVRRARRDIMFLTGPKGRRVPRVSSIPSPTIFSGFAYWPLPRWVLGHVPGFPGVLRVPSAP